MARTFKAVANVCLLVACALGPRTAVAGPQEEAKAGRLFDKAETEYQAGHFQAAIDLLLEAQQIAPDAVLDYNLARAYEGLGNLEASLASYKAYLAADPQSKDRGAVEARVKTIEAQLAERARKAGEPEPPPKDKAPPPGDPRRPSALPWLLAGAGALTFGAGGILGGFSLSSSSEADDPATTGVDAVTLQEEASDFALQANILFGVGGAITLAGVVWGIVDVVGTSNANEPRATVWVSPTGARLQVDF